MLIWNVGQLLAVVFRDDELLRVSERVRKIRDVQAVRVGAVQGGLARRTA